MPETTEVSAPQAGEFDNLGSAEDLDFQDSVEVPDEAAPQASEEPKPKEAVQDQPQAERTKPEAPPSQTGEGAKAQPEAPKTPAPAVKDSLQGIAEQLTQHADAVVAELAETRFKLSDAELNELEVDPAKAVPKLLAKVYHQAMVSTLMHIHNHVPRIVSEAFAMQRAQEIAESAFYSRFKALDRAKHHNDVMSFASALRQANPGISQDDLFAMVGAAVMAKYGLKPPAERDGRAAPFVPARPGLQVRTSPEPESPYAGLGMDFDD